MKHVKRFLKTFWQDDSGLTTVEYAVAGALIAGAVILSFTNLGAKVASVLDYLVSSINPPK